MVENAINIQKKSTPFYPQVPDYPDSSISTVLTDLDLTDTSPDSFKRSYGNYKSDLVQGLGMSYEELFNSYKK